MNQQKARGRAASEEGEKPKHCNVQEAKWKEVFRGGGSGQLCPELGGRPSEGEPGSDLGLDRLLKVIQPGRDSWPAIRLRRQRVMVSHLFRRVPFRGSSFFPS